MESLRRNLIESVNLENCFVAIFPKMKKDPSRTFYKFARTMCKDHFNDVANEVLYMTSINLLKETMVILNQLWKANPDRINEKLINKRHIYNMIKDKISKDGKSLPFNTKELYKRIRESIAHNSSEKQNFVYNLQNFELNLGKVDGSDFVIELSPSELNQLIAVLIYNMQSVSKTRIAYYDTEITSREDIENALRMYHNESGEGISLDKNQVERAYNYFRFFSNDKTIEGNRDVINKIIAIPQNPETLLHEKLNAIKVVVKMTSSSSFNDIRSQYEEISQDAEFVSIYFAIVSNMLFEIVSSQTNEEIKEMLSGTGVSLNDEQIRHFRNSMCHGRYFHDFDKTFYFYDGKKDLNHAATLTIKDVNKILNKVALGKHSFAVLK